MRRPRRWYHSFRAQLALVTVAAFAAVSLLGWTAFRGIVAESKWERLDLDLREAALSQADTIMRAGLQPRRGQHPQPVPVALTDTRLPGFLALVASPGSTTPVVVTSDDWKDHLPTLQDAFGHVETTPDSADSKPPPDPGPPRGPRPRRADRNHPDGPPPPPAIAPVRLEFTDSDFATLEVAGSRTRWLAVPAGSQILFVGAGVDRLEAELAELDRAALFICGPVILLAGFAAWFVAGFGLRPIDRLAEETGRVTVRELGRRIDPDSVTDEFVPLVKNHNAMLERLENSFRQASRFSADAAHELKTPIAILQGRLEEALRDAGWDTDAQQLYADLLEETQRLKNITEQLLLLARGDSGTLVNEKQSLDFSALVADACEDARLLDEACRFRVHLSPQLTVRGEPVLLAQAVHNLLANAVKYNRADGAVDVDLSGSLAPERVVTLTVTNTGDRIPEGTAGHIFERFYRGDPAHRRSGESAGLGLALAREIALAHSGSLELVENKQDHIRFRMRLPWTDSAREAVC